MPGFDGTGPRGQGPGTGGGRGYCGGGAWGGPRPGVAGGGRWCRPRRGFMGPGWGRARGFGPYGAGYGPGYGPGYVPPQDEPLALKAEAARLKGELEAIETRLAELEGSGSAR